MPRYDMTRPCKHCPFRTDENAIRFQGPVRALEIAFTAYRFGFPCHTSADYVENETDEGDESGYVFGEQTQTCAGHIIMEIQQSDGHPWPGINLDYDLLDRLKAKMDFVAPVFHDLNSFLQANQQKPPPS